MSGTSAPPAGRLRVIFLTHNFPRHPGDVSGTFLALLARALIARGVVVRVVAPADEGEVGPAELEGIPVRRVRYAAATRETLAYRGTMAEAGRTPGGVLRTLALGRALRRAAREELRAGAHLVHAHWWVPGGLAAPPEAPLVVTLHGTDAALLERSAVARWLARPLLRRAGLVTTVSAPLARVVHHATGRVVDPTRQQPMPTDTARFTRWSEGGGGLVLVARLTRQKRVDLALRALARVTRVGSSLQLTIIGDGPERPNLEGLCHALGLADCVRFEGAQPPAVVAERLSHADLSIFSARNEGYGLAAAESFMAGVPVVACLDGGGVLDVVPAHGAGRRVEPNPAALADGIRSLLGNLPARAAARELGARLRTELSPAHVAERCEGWYREVLSA
jgi:glycosyltransferase involved in cell wall biosynthesis